MSTFSQTLLALQVLNGTKFYRAQVVRPTQKAAPFSFVVRSETEQTLETLHMIEKDNNFLCVRITQAVDLDFTDATTDIPALLLPLPGLLEAYENDRHFQLEAHKKIARAQALQSAKIMLQDAGFDLTILQLEDKK